MATSAEKRLQEKQEESIAFKKEIDRICKEKDVLQKKIDKLSKNIYFTYKDVHRLQGQLADLKDQEKFMRAWSMRAEKEEKYSAEEYLSDCKVEQPKYIY